MRAAGNRGTAQIKVKTCRAAVVASVVVVKEGCNIAQKRRAPQPFMLACVLACFEISSPCSGVFSSVLLSAPGHNMKSHGAGLRFRVIHHVFSGVQGTVCGSSRWRALVLARVPCDRDRCRVPCKVGTSDVAARRGAHADTCWLGEALGGKGIASARRPASGKTKSGQLPRF